MRIGSVAWIHGAKAFRVSVLLAAVLLCVTAALPQDLYGMPAAAGDQFTPTGNLATARFAHTAVRLANGKILVAGGRINSSNDDITASAELYDPVTGSWSATGSLAMTRAGHSMVLLPNGKVLVAGGYRALTCNSSDALLTVEEYDPATGTWSIAGSLGQPHFLGTAVVLQSGKVLFAAGGHRCGPILGASEIYDPATNTSAPTGSMLTARRTPASILLANGKVLAAGGGSLPSQNYPPVSLSSAELYDPSSGTWSATGSMGTSRLLRADEGPIQGGLIGLNNGKVLIVGGLDRSNNALPCCATEVTASAELYDPAAGAWAPTGAMASRRWEHTVTALDSGQVLVVGGHSGSVYLNSSEIYDPASGTFAAGPNLSATRSRHTASLLTSGKVLVAAGINGSNQVNTAELYSADITAPTTTANAAGYTFDTWTNASSINVALTATDEPGGSGVKNITYSASGAQAIPSTVQNGGTATVPAITVEGITTLKFYATDNAGNVEMEQSVTIKIDRTAPSASCNVSPSALWPPNHKMVNITASLTVVDSGSGDGGFKLVAVTSSEPDNGLGDGDTAGDINGWAIGTNDTAGQLRAERSGTGSGRVYTLQYEARDQAGNTATTQCTVTVPLNR